MLGCHAWGPSGLSLICIFFPSEGAKSLLVGGSKKCLVPYLVNTSKLEAVQSISIVTGYGKTRARGARLNDDGMRLRVRAMLKYMSIKETPQPNKGRIHINKAELIIEVKKNGGKVLFDLAGYTRFKEEETTSNKFPDVPQKVRARFRPARPGEGPLGTFIREGYDNSPSSSQLEDRREARRESSRSETFHHTRRDSRRTSYEGEDRRSSQSRRGADDWYNDRRGSYMDRHSDRRGSYGENPERRSSYVESLERRGSYGDNPERRGSYMSSQERRGSYEAPIDRRGSYDGNYERRAGHEGSYDRRGSYEGSYERRLYDDRRVGYEGNSDRRSSHLDTPDRRGSYVDAPDRRRSYRDWDGRDGSERRAPRDYDAHPDRSRLRDDLRVEDYRRDDIAREPRRYEDRDQMSSRSSFQSQRRESSYHSDGRYEEDMGAGRRNSSIDDVAGRRNSSIEDVVGRRSSSIDDYTRGSRDSIYASRDRPVSDRPWERDGGDFGAGNHDHDGGDGRASGGDGFPEFQARGSPNVKSEEGASSVLGHNTDYAKDHSQPDRYNESGDPDTFDSREMADARQYGDGDGSGAQPAVNGDADNGGEGSGEGGSRKRGFDEFQKQQANRGYSIEPAYSKRRSL